MNEKTFIAKVHEIDDQLIESSGQDVCQQYTGSLQTFGRTVMLDGYFEKQDLQDIINAMDKINELKQEISEIDNKKIYGNDDLGEKYRK